MSKPKKMSRRKFLARSAVFGAAGPLLLASCARARQDEAQPAEQPVKKVSANDRIGVGVIGPGRRGRQIMGLPRDGQIVAIADVNKPRMDEVAAGKDWRKYQNYRDMLECDDIDAVIVATPDHWHTLPSIHACQAGKDVYCEKPMTLTVREGRHLVDAVRKHNRVFQTGSQQRSMDPCRYGCELVQNGRLGKIKEVHASNFESPWECTLPAQPTPEGLDWDMWCGQTEPRPYHIELYTPRVRGQEAGWISYRPYSGGEMTGWGAHGLDMIQWALGMDESGPVEIRPIPGTEKNDGVHKGPTCQVEMRYANGVLLKLDGKGPGGGGVFVGEEGRLLIDRGKCESQPASIAQEPIGDSEIHLYKSTHHMQNWLDCIRSRERCIADVEMGHRSTTVCHLGNIARWTGRKLKWDPKKERFIGDAEANALLERPMRAPYAI